jgi:ABC-2 type transport system permease protein
MKQFASFVRKEFYHIFRDRRTVMILFMMPVIQMLLFGFALSTEVKNVRVAVFDPSRDISTGRIIRQLEANRYFTLVEELPGAAEGVSALRPGDIHRVLSGGMASLAVVFGADFHSRLMTAGEASVQLVADAADPNQARAFTAYASGIISAYCEELLRGAEAPPLRIIPEIRMIYNPQMNGAYNFVPGVMGLILMLVCAMMTSISIVREKERGTMEALLVSPVKPACIILSKMTPYFALAIADLCIILLMSVHVLHVPVSGSLLLLFAMALLFILAALSLGLLISNLVDSQVAAMLISGMGMMLPTIILSGLIFPVESMPPVLQWISSVIPARWFISAVRKVMIQGVDFVHVAEETLVLAGMTALILSMSLITFKVRLKK